MIPIPANVWVIAGACLLSFTAAWTAQGWRYGEQISDMKLEASESALQAAIKARNKTQAMQSKITALDTQKTKELNRAKSEINRMRESVSNGTGWLQLNASCPKLPGLTLDTGLGNGAAPRLTDSAIEGYLLLRERAILCTKQVEVLQGAIRVISAEP